MPYHCTMEKDKPTITSEKLCELYASELVDRMSYEELVVWAKTEMYANLKDDLYDDLKEQALEELNMDPDTQVLGN